MYFYLFNYRTLLARISERVALNVPAFCLLNKRRAKKVVTDRKWGIRDVKSGQCEENCMPFCHIFADENLK